MNSEAEAFIRGIRIDYLLFSCGAVDNSGYLLDFYIPEVHIVKMVMERSAKAYLAIDASKFTTSAPIEIAHLSKIDALFVDQLPSKSINSIAATGDVEIFTPQGD